MNPSMDAVGRDDENENENDDENDDALPARWKSPYNSRYTITKQTLRNHPVPESRASRPSRARSSRSLPEDARESVDDDAVTHATDHRTRAHERRERALPRVRSRAHHRSASSRVASTTAGTIAGDRARGRGTLGGSRLIKGRHDTRKP